MKVKIFDESHEKDLETAINQFLSEKENINVIDIKFQTAISIFSEEQVYCFTAMIIYTSWKIWDTSIKILIYENF